MISAEGKMREGVASMRERGYEAERGRMRRCRRRDSCMAKRREGEGE